MTTAQQRVRPYTIAVLFGVASISIEASAYPIYQSASGGSADCSSGGSVIDSAQYLGVHFSLTSTSTLSGVGGQVCGVSASDDFFAAVLPLNGPNALPTFDPLDIIANSLASTLFTPGDTGADTTIPLSITLGAGDYALVFGSGLLGATGFGWMPNTNTDLPGASYFSADLSVPTWYGDNFSGARFFVLGTNTVPEPGTLTLALLGLGCGVLARRRHAKRNRRA